MQGARRISEGGVGDEGVRHVSRGEATGRGVAGPTYLRGDGAHGARGSENLPPQPSA